MLPEFNLTNEIVRKNLHSFLKEKVKEYFELPFSDNQYTFIHEGDGMLINYTDDRSHDSPLKNIVDEFTVSTEELIENPTLTFTKLEEMAKKIADKKGKLVFDTISEVADKFGRSSTRAGDPTGETILEMLEGIQLSFDEEGKPQMPTFYCAPEMVEKIQQANKKMFDNPMLMQRYIQLLNTKKQEWLDRKNNRKLVD